MKRAICVAALVLLPFAADAQQERGRQAGNQGKQQQGKPPKKDPEALKKARAERARELQQLDEYFQKLQKELEQQYNAEKEKILAKYKHLGPLESEVQPPPKPPTAEEEAVLQKLTEESVRHADFTKDLEKRAAALKAESKEDELAELKKERIREYQRHNDAVTALHEQVSKERLAEIQRWREMSHKDEAEKKKKADLRARKEAEMAEKREAGGEQGGKKKEGGEEGGKKGAQEGAKKRGKEGGG